MSSQSPVNPCCLGDITTRWQLAEAIGCPDAALDLVVLDETQQCGYHRQKQQHQQQQQHQQGRSNSCPLPIAHRNAGFCVFHRAFFWPLPPPPRGATNPVAERTCHGQPDLTFRGYYLLGPDYLPSVANYCAETPAKGATTAAISASCLDLSPQYCCCTSQVCQGIGYTPHLFELPRDLAERDRSLKLLTGTMQLSHAKMQYIMEKSSTATSGTTTNSSSVTYFLAHWHFAPEDKILVDGNWRLLGSRSNSNRKQFVVTDPSAWNEQSLPFPPPIYDLAFFVASVRIANTKKSKELPHWFTGLQLRFAQVPISSSSSLSPSLSSTQQKQTKRHHDEITSSFTSATLDSFPLVVATASSARFKEGSSVSTDTHPPSNKATTTQLSVKTATTTMTTTKVAATNPCLSTATLTAITSPPPETKRPMPTIATAYYPPLVAAATFTDNSTSLPKNFHPPSTDATNTQLPIKAATKVAAATNLRLSIETLGATTTLLPSGTNRQADDCLTKARTPCPESFDVTKSTSSPPPKTPRLDDRLADSATPSPDPSEVAAMTTSSPEKERHDDLLRTLPDVGGPVAKKTKGDAEVHPPDLAIVASSSSEPSTARASWGSGISTCVRRYNELIAYAAAPPEILSGMVDISLDAIREHFVCSLCGGYYREPYTINECLHTFCKSCLFVSFYRARYKQCPECSIVIGSDTARSAVFRSDGALRELLKALFPVAHEEDEANESEFYRQLGIPLKSSSVAAERNGSSKDLHESSTLDQIPAISHVEVDDEVDFTLKPGCQWRLGGGGQPLPRLRRPCLRTSGRLKIGQLKKYLKSQLPSSLQEYFNSALELEIACNGVSLGNELSLVFVLRTVWQDSNVDLELTYQYARDE